MQSNFKFLVAEGYNFGEVSLSTMKSLSRVIDPASSLDISEKVIWLINNDNSSFIWRKKYPLESRYNEGCSEGWAECHIFCYHAWCSKIKMLHYTLHNELFWSLTWSLRKWEEVICHYDVIMTWQLWAMPAWEAVWSLPAGSPSVKLNKHNLSPQQYITVE